MIDVTIVSKDPKDFKRFTNAELPVEPYVTYIDELKEPTKAWNFKMNYGAAMSPFVLISRDFEKYDAIYHEAVQDPVQTAIEILQKEIKQY